MKMKLIFAYILSYARACERYVVKDILKFRVIPMFIHGKNFIILALLLNKISSQPGRPLNLRVGMVTIINLEVRLDAIGLAMISSNYIKVPI